MWDDVGGAGRRVNLGGRSAHGGKEDRKHFLDRQKQERKKREDERTRLKAATDIQRVWRSHRDVTAARRVRRERWEKQAGDVAKVEKILAIASKPTGKVCATAITTCLPGLLFIFRETDAECFRTMCRWLNVVRQEAPSASPLHGLHIVETSERLRHVVRVRNLLRLAARYSFMSEAFSILDCLGSVLALALSEAEENTARERLRDSLCRVLGDQRLETFLPELLAVNTPSAVVCRLFDSPLLISRLLSAPGLFQRLGDIAFVPALAAAFGGDGTAVPPTLDLPSGTVSGLPPAVHALGNALALLVKAARAGASLDVGLAVLTWAHMQPGVPGNVLDPSLVGQELFRQLQAHDCLIALANGMMIVPTIARLAALLRLFFRPDAERPSPEIVSVFAYRTPLASCLAQVLIVAYEKAGSAEALFRSDSAKGGQSDVAFVVWAFATIYSLLLQVLYDEEFLGPENPLSRPVLRKIALYMNRFAYAMVTSNAYPPYRLSLIKFVRDLHNRDCRTHFVEGPQDWLVTRSRVLEHMPRLVPLREEQRLPSATVQSLSREASVDVVMNDGDVEMPANDDDDDDREWVGRGSELLELVLEHIPHVLPFEDRVTIFHRRILADQENRDEGRSPFGARTFTRIRRTHILEDGLASFQSMQTDELRDQYKVQFIGIDGEPEPGIDGGGLFKEFFIQLSRESFDPGKGLFKEVSERRLFPDSTSPTKFGPHYKEFLHFLGQFIGKALYEQVLLEPVFSPVFLNSVLGRRSSVHDVAALDEQVHKSLLWLKKCPAEDVESLGLTFSISEEGGRVVDLTPNGQDTPVTAENRIMYIHRLAYYRCNLQVRTMVSAFAEGLKTVIPERWLSSFAPHELNMLISGVGAGGFNVDDLCANTVYSGGYTPRHQTVQMFWCLMHEMTAHDRSQFLMFVTSCSRAPLLGFQKLYPKFAIHFVPDLARLPTASTCANLLKLPAYDDYATLKAKMMQSIHSGAGFDMS
eukprot:TRINITY_DN38457_c0_g2_i1.p1 TRINITY_DN38457_c0_g2~~TRINITY_DN38457_c0_g2_i1.p1  ORF type:complete len:985 (+),score=140.25 TRINITY_DN38457_c0_g2_i1:64-3018(+)